MLLSTQLHLVLKLMHEVIPPLSHTHCCGAKLSTGAPLHLGGIIMLQVLLHQAIPLLDTASQGPLGIPLIEHSSLDIEVLYRGRLYPC